MIASSAIERRARTKLAWLDRENYVLRQGLLKLLAIKDSDVRLLTLEQARYAVDQGVHAGGAFSATAGKIIVQLPSWATTGDGTYDSSGFCVAGTGTPSPATIQ